MQTNNKSRKYGLKTYIINKYLGSYISNKHWICNLLKLKGLLIKK